MGRHLLFEAFASGGMATVHFGRLVGPAGFGRMVAMKRLHAQFASSPEFVRMLLDEARLTGRIRHPNVVPTLDVVLEDREVFVVMEYVHGESFARLLMRHKTPPTPEIVTALVTQALLGLHAAHETRDERGAPLGIIHRDATPHNVMVDSQGLARIIDFGVAKARSVIHTTGEGRFKGKVSYMAPEQLQDGSCDRRADVFAASVMLWEGITRKHLFTRDSPGATITAVLKGDVRRLSEIRAGLPHALDDVVMKGLSPNPDDRFDTALEMAEALTSVLMPASQLEVARWVQEVAGEELQARHRMLEEIESELYRDVDKIRQSVDRVLSGEPPSSPFAARFPLPTSDGASPRDGALPAASEMPTIELPREMASGVCSRPMAVESDGSSPASSVVMQPRRRQVVPWYWAVAVLLATLVATALLLAPGRPTIPTLATGLVPRKLPRPSVATPSVDPPEPAKSTSPPSSPSHLGNRSSRDRSGKCSPPWTIDDKGRKRFKLECF